MAKRKSKCWYCGKPRGKACCPDRVAFLQLTEQEQEGVKTMYLVLAQEEESNGEKVEE